MRELKEKPYKVTDPSGKVHLVYAKTQMGAIGDVKVALRKEWKAELATGEDLYIAARDGLPILNAPASIATAPQQTDAFGD